MKHNFYVVFMYRIEKEKYICSLTSLICFLYLKVRTVYIKCTYVVKSIISLLGACKNDFHRLTR